MDDQNPSNVNESLRENDSGSESGSSSEDETRERDAPRQIRRRVVPHPSVERGARTRGAGRNSGAPTIVEFHSKAKGEARRGNRIKVFERSGDAGEHVGEENRIGRILRSLTRESDEDALLKLCQQLQELLFLQENLRYVRHSLTNIGHALMEVLKTTPNLQIRQAALTGLARLGYVSDHEFSTFSHWLLNCYHKEQNEKVCCAILNSVTELLTMDKANHRLKNADTILLPGLQSILESADTPALFEAALSPVLLIAQKNSRSFAKYFQDTGDILIGWLMDPSQPAGVVERASEALKLLHPFWQQQVEFAFTLLSQFLEDLEEYTKAVKGPAENADETEGNKSNPLTGTKKISSLLNVFAVVAGQVWTARDNGVFSKNFLNNALTKIATSAAQIISQLKENGEQSFLHETSFEIPSQLLKPANNCCSLLIDWIGPASLSSASLERVLEFVSAQLETLVIGMEVALLESLVDLMGRVARLHSTCVNVDVARDWMKSLRGFWLRPHPLITARVIKLLRTLISTKNISLLIEIYRHFVSELGKAMTELDKDPMAEELALLLLAPLGDLGKSSNLVSMWALEPSLLELLISKLQPVDNMKTLIQRHPSLFLGILRVLHSHCKHHSSFVASSSLVVSSTAALSVSSPSSGNLGAILMFITDCCSVLDAAAPSVVLLLLQWSLELIVDCRPCVSQLLTKAAFHRFLVAVVQQVGSSEPFDAAAARTMQELLKAVVDLPEITTQYDVMRQLVSSCLRQTKRNKGKFLAPLMRCPPQMMMSFVPFENPQTQSHLASWIDYDALISAGTFQQLFGFILKGESLPSAEISYWFHAGGASTNSKPPADYSDWLLAQAALLCVCSKLRTPFGRPQDTFGTIEEALKRMAKDEDVTESDAIGKLQRHRFLLRFFEILEKLMFNSFDGSAVAIPAAPKAVRHFFRSNQSTCQEWVNRLSSVAMTASIRAGIPASAAKYGLRLVTLVAQSQRPLAPSDVVAYLITLVDSLVQLKAGKQIRGLKQWLRSQKFFAKLELDLNWMEGAALQAEHKYESAIERYMEYLTGAEMPNLRSFIANQIVVCYVSLCDWNGYQMFRTEFADADLEVNFETWDALAAFDLMEHVSWPSQTRGASWNCNILLEQSRSCLVHAAQEIRSSYLQTDLGSTKKIVDYFVEDILRSSTRKSTSDVYLLWFPITNAIVEHGSDVYKLIGTLEKVFRDCGHFDGFSSSFVHLEWLRWMRWFSQLNPRALELSQQISRLDLEAARVARREGNFRLAESLLIHAFRVFPRELPTLLMNEALKLNAQSPNFHYDVQLQLEGAKLLHARGDTEAAVNVLTQSTLCLSRSLNNVDRANQVLMSSLARGHVFLADWCAGKTLDQLPPALGELLKDRNGPESHTEKLLRRATELGPNLPKAWLMYGNFLYESATRIISLADSFDNPEYSSSLTEACRAYFKYLTLKGRVEKLQENSDLVKVTLRILRLLVKEVCSSSEQLRTVMETGLNETSAEVWKMLTPQLFSLLQYGRPWLQTVVSSLLERLAIRWPHLLIFPASVGAAGLAWTWSPADAKTLNILQGGEKDSDSLQLDEDFTREVEKDQQDYAEVQQHYERIVLAIKQVVPEMVSHTETFLRELRRLVLLWDELWLVTLQHVHPQVEQLLSKLQQQVIKIQKNSNLNDDEKKKMIRENYRIVLKPIVHTLETVASITNATAETPHEQSFQNRFGSLINDALLQLEEVALSERPHDIWLPFKNILQQLQAISHRRGALRLNDVSPVLAAFNGTSIPMPGLMDGKDAVTILSLEKNIAVLPTKTKPKKLLIVGSNGKRYAYLLKGLEDLHLDERMMQLLAISNLLLAKEFRSHEQTPLYRARHYAVIPLGPRSGLIQWVEGVTPMFALYKRWLQRQAALTQKSESSGQNAGVPRPSELFYAKLNPLLEAEGLSGETRQRNQWPKEILRQVYQELVAETPKDLLSRELWLGSENSHHWWDSTARFARSCAVMSIIGYVIGLGDRHLDNVLVDLRNGEVVHIDYNVCFEKGRQLRVPEKVPFRLTPNLEHALGPSGTGLEGTFRLSCIDALRTLRDNSEVILTLLEHFIYDPLIDWKAQSGSSESSLAGLYVINPTLAAECSRQRRAMELELTKELFALKISELEPDWLENKSELEAVVPTVGEPLQKWIGENASLTKLNEDIQDSHEELAVIVELASNKQHMFRQPEQLQQVLSPYRAALEREQMVRTAWLEKKEDCVKWVQLCEIAFNSLLDNQLSFWHQLVTKPLLPGVTGYPLVMDFLISSGHSGLAQQGQLFEQQVLSVMEAQQHAAAVVVELLSRYAPIAKLYPPSVKDKHRIHLMVKWIEELESDLSLSKCHNVAQQFNEQFGLDRSTLAVQQQNVLNFQVSLSEVLALETDRLRRAAILAGADETLAAAEFMESKEAVENFLLLHNSSEQEMGHQALHSALLSILSEVYAAVETADLNIAAGQTTSSDSDELYVETLQFNISSLLALLDLLPEKSQLKDLMEVLRLLEQVFRDVEDLIFHSSSVILPELLRCMEAEESSVSEILNKIRSMSNTQDNFELRSKEWEDLVAALGNNEDRQPMKQGQMLFLGLNGLYEKLENSTRAVLTASRKLLLEKRVNGGKFVRQTLDIADACVNTNWKEAMLFSKVSCMEDMFQSCSMFTASFWARDRNADFSARAYFALIDTVATDWIRDFCSGLTSVCLGGICQVLGTRSAEDATIEKLEDLVRGVTDSFPSPEILAQARAAVESVFDSWRRLELTRKAQKQQKLHELILQHVQQQLAAHAWIHDDLLNVHGTSARFQFLVELRQGLSYLLTHSPRLITLHQQMDTLSAQVEQHMKWSATSDPSLISVLTEFKLAQESCLSALQEASLLATSVGGVSSAVLHYETLRTRSAESLTYDSTFSQLLSRTIEMCTVKDSFSAVRFSAAELRVAGNIPLESGATDEWIEKTQKGYSEHFLKLKTRLDREQQQHSFTEEQLRTAGADLRGVLSTHHQIISDLRTILKNMARTEAGEGKVTKYLKTYQEFCELGTGLARCLTSKDFEAERMKKCMEEVDKLQHLIGSVYNVLPTLGLAGYIEGPTASNDQESNRTEPGTATAKSIWHRVRLKLEGKDFNPDVQLSVEEQVDKLISQALDIDHLALLYEGWTPWV